jgi:hypothetical protein
MGLELVWASYPDIFDGQDKPQRGGFLLRHATTKLYLGPEIDGIRGGSGGAAPPEK